MGARGQSRNSKRSKAPPKKPALSLIEEIHEELRKSLTYLKAEREIYAATPGNNQDIIRISKALASIARELQPQERPADKVDPRRIFQSFMESQTAAEEEEEREAD